MTRETVRRLGALALTIGASACAGTAGAPGAAPAPATRGALAGDTSTATLLPPGFGTLRQQDLAVRVSLVGGTTVQLLPLDESFIRLLAPDSYRAMRDLQASRRVALDSIAQRYRYPRYSVWYVSFFGREQGEARFSPFEVILTNAGREFRPLDVVPVTRGFGEQRLQQRDVQSALYVFDGSLDLNQPLELTVETTRDGTTWSGQILPRVERERALVRSRAGRSSAAPAAATPRPR
ncbi:hypothetical protein [Roseisolibacter agri]|uniref:Uncharacterized protein n=1 Tax=Roseisolibacter agri TaxID=2014610 RepID=A0AA37V2L8_9BACT|nr:hypothetical protein [Roseisolibacter agri]GLC28015.1 hypothetical protein rosag_45280 [Roseisolibacter agri]